MERYSELDRLYLSIQYAEWMFMDEQKSDPGAWTFPFLSILRKQTSSLRYVPQDGLECYPSVRLEQRFPQPTQASTGSWYQSDHCIMTT